MKLAIAAILTTIFTLAAATAAQAWNGNSARADYCTYTDNGWEEHWSGHDSCGECLRKHGKCQETCYAKEYKVTVVGTVRDSWSGNEREEEFTGVSDSEWKAESEAENACRWRNASDCRVKSRDSQNNQVSSRGC